MIVKSSIKATALSFFLVVAFLFNSPVSFSESLSGSLPSDVPFAAAAMDFGAGVVVRAALGALTVQTLSDMSPSDIVEAILKGGGSTLPPDFTFAQSLAEFLNRQTIKIRPDSVTIDGVEYSDVWLPHDCADKFRTNAFDFITRYNISSESVGTFVSGVGFYYGIPAFSDGTNTFTQSYYLPTGSSSVGDLTFRSSSYGANRYRWYGYYNGHYTLGNNTVFTSPVGFFIRNGTYCFFGDSSQGNPYYEYGITGSCPLDSQSFSFDWVAGSVPATPLPTSDGLRLRIPSSYVSGLPQVLDPSSSSYSTDLATVVDSLVNAGTAGEVADPAFEAWDSPAPSTGTIAEEPYSSLSGSLSGIQSIISRISSSVSGIADSIVGADSTFFGNIVSALAAPFESVFSVFRSGVSIWRYVVSWVGTISAPFSWSLSALGSAGSYFLSPIYAAAAAAVVLAVYKKFGR